MTPLLHRSRSQSRKPDHVADGVYVRHGSLKMLVDLQAAALVGGQAGSIEHQATARADATCGIHKQRGADLLSTMQREHDHAVMALCDRDHFFAEAKRDAD